MVTTSLTSPHLKQSKDWSRWFLQLQFHAHRQNIWDYINPNAVDAQYPTQRIPLPPTLEETIAKRRNGLQELYARELRAAEPGSHTQPRRQVTEQDVREEYAARLRDYDLAVAELKEIQKGYRIVWNWVHSSVEITLLSDAQEAATAASESNLQGVVRALQDRLANKKSSVLGQFFPSFDIRHLRILNPLTLMRFMCAKTNSKAKTPSASKLLQLPNEMLLEILEYLELHDTFILGQTCKVLHIIIQRDWKVTFNGLSSLGKTSFLSGIAFIMPNHWVCAFCDKLHYINQKDLPWGAKRYYCHPSYEPSATGSCCLVDIQERHVQLALKFTRLQTINQDYLRKILAPFTYRIPFGDGYQIFQAFPKIITERFVLYTRHKFVDDRGLSVHKLRYMGICPHIWVESSGDPGLTSFDGDVQLALTQPGNEITGYCSRCPTDWSIIASPGKFVLHVWYDFGSYKSPRDAGWTVHTASHDSIGSGGPTVYHDPGSIRRLYVTGSGVPLAELAELSST